MGAQSRCNTVPSHPRSPPHCSPANLPLPAVQGGEMLRGVLAASYLWQMWFEEAVPTATLWGLSFQLITWLLQVLSVTIRISQGQDERCKKSFLLAWPLFSSSPFEKAGGPMGSGFSFSIISSHSPRKFWILSKVHIPASTQLLISSPESVS